jgi:hypothetical protein
MNAQNQLVNTAILLALALTSELNSSDVNNHGMAPLFRLVVKKISKKKYLLISRKVKPGPIEKNTKYKTAQTIVR